MYGDYKFLVLFYLVIQMIRGDSMQLNHLNLMVNNAEASREFLEKYFDMKCVNSRGKGFAAMFDDNQFVLTRMKG